MATTSTAPEVRAWLIEELGLRLPAGVELTRLEPKMPKREAVWLGRASAATSEIHGIAPVTIRRASEYVVDVVFSSWVTAEDDVAEDRVFVLFGHLEELLAEVPKPSTIDGLLDVALAGWVLESDVGEDGPPVVWITAQVRCRDHLE